MASSDEQEKMKEQFFTIMDSFIYSIFEGINVVENMDKYLIKNKKLE